MRSYLTLVTIMVLLSGGCGRDRDEIVPPTLHLGEDVCERCSMIISEKRYAGAIGMRRGNRVEYLLFDDVGEMLQESSVQADEVRWFGVDANDDTWIDAERATFLRSPKLTTPMGYGIAAYAKREDAIAAQEEVGGRLSTFDEIRSVPIRPMGLDDA